LLLGALAEIYLPAFGFLPGKEVKNAKLGNLGLQDRELKSSDLLQVVTLIHLKKNVSL